MANYLADIFTLSTSLAGLPGMSAYAAIASALYARERTGRGNWVRASLLETAVSIAVARLEGAVRGRASGAATRPACGCALSR